MHWLALGATTAIAAVLSIGANAADLAYPPTAGSEVRPPPYGMAPPPPVAPPQVIIVPGRGAPPPYNGAMVPPPVVGSAPGTAAPPLAPPPNVPPGAFLSPRAACVPAWRCGNGGCGWQGCTPQPELYRGPYGSPDPYGVPSPQVYPGPYGSPGPYGLPSPQVYPGPETAPVPESYSSPYPARVYAGPTGPYSVDRNPYRP
jgi:hypothetical protein